MTYLIVLIALALLPVLAIMLLRVNAAIAFMSLALGSVLVTYVAPDITTIFGGFSAGNGQKYQWVQLGLLVVPFVLAILFTRANIKGRGKHALNLLPALASGLLFVLLVIPLLPADLQRHMHAETAWRQLDNLQTAVVLGGAAFSLLFLLVTHRKHHSDEGGKHKH